MESKKSGRKMLFILGEGLGFILILDFFLMFCALIVYAGAVVAYTWNFHPRIESTLQSIVQESKISICSSGRSIDEVWRDYNATRTSTFSAGASENDDQEQSSNKLLTLENELKKCPTEGTVYWRERTIKWTFIPIMIDVQHQSLDTPFVEKMITFSSGKDTIEMSNLGRDFPGDFDDISYSVMKINGNEPMVWGWLPFVPSRSKEVLEWMDKK